MMSQRNAVRTVAVCLVMLALGSATSGYPAMAQGTVTLRLSHDQPVTHPNTFQLEVFARLVEQRSRGTLKVTTFPAGQLFSETDVLPALERGEVDIALLQPSKVASVVPAMLITELPSGVQRSGNGPRAHAIPRVPAEYLEFHFGMVR